MQDLINLEGHQAPQYLAKEYIQAYKRNAKLYRMDSSGMRFYYRFDRNNEVRFYGSVTSVKKQVTGLPRAIIDKEIEMGKIAFNKFLNERSKHGTFFHTLAAELTITDRFDLKKLPTLYRDFIALNGLSEAQTSYWPNAIAKGLQSWVQCMQDYDIQPIGIEVPCYSDRFGIAGTIDVVCSMYDKLYSEATPLDKRKRVIAIIDWKSGNIFEDYALQLELNKITWAESVSFAPQPTKLLNWTWNDWRDKPTYNLVNQTENDYTNVLGHYLAIYRETGTLKPKSLKKYSGILHKKADMSKFMQITSAEQFIKQQHQTK